MEMMEVMEVMEVNVLIPNEQEAKNFASRLYDKSMDKIFGMVKRAFLKTSFFSKNESTKNFHYHKQEVYCNTTNGPRFKQNEG